MQNCLIVAQGFFPLNNLRTRNPLARDTIEKIPVISKVSSMLIHDSVIIVNTTSFHTSADSKNPVLTLNTCSINESILACFIDV